MKEFFKYPEEIRRAIYKTNAIESLNYQLRKVTKNRWTFSTDDAIYIQDTVFGDSERFQKMDDAD